MSDLDLTDATEAAHDAVDAYEQTGGTSYYAIASNAVRAAAPVIERQVRDRIAADIEALGENYPEDLFRPVNGADAETAQTALTAVGLELDRFSADMARVVIRNAARIARGGAA